MQDLTQRRIVKGCKEMDFYKLGLGGRTPLLQKRKVIEIIAGGVLPEDHPLRPHMKGDHVTAQDLKRDDFLRALADFGAYQNGHGSYQPAFTWRHSFIEGARKAKVKMGRGSIWKLLQGTMFPAPAEPLITREGQSLPRYDTLYRSAVRTTMGLVVQYQARIDLPWECSMMLLVQDANMTDPMLRDVIAGGGLYAGIGSWVSGGFGRYALTSFEEIEAPDESEMLALMQPA